MRSLLCLISGQHVPNLLSNRSGSPCSDRLVRIATPLTKAKNKYYYILNALTVRGLDYQKTHDIKDLAKEGLYLSKR